MRRVLIAMIVAISLTSLAFADGGVKKRRAKPFEFGSVTIDNYSVKAGLPPVVFSHWAHRMRFTCRLCHVDIAFAMKTGATKVRAVNNERGFYCGTCHDGKFKYNDKIVFAACAKNVTPEEAKRCEYCHATDSGEKSEADFLAATEKLPKEHLGNGIDWEKSEAMGLIKPIDFLEGISIKRPTKKMKDELSLDSKYEGMSDIIFSHKKHSVWNGCEVCHPDPFVGIKKGSTKYSMIDIFKGKFCGLCHLNAAFPMTDCQRCHTKPVQ
jgi:c(7)-type cytochrome triheme protein